MRIASMAFCLLIAAAASAGATEFRTGHTVSVAAEEVIDDDLFIAGTNVKVAGEVTGDLLAAGRMVRLTGPVGGTVMAAGEDVRVTGDVEGSVRAAGRSVTLGGEVGRNAVGVGQSVLLADDGRIARDLHTAANSIEVDGTVGRNARLIGAGAAVRGKIGKTLYYEGETVRLAESAEVRGDLVYRSPGVAEIAEGAVIVGETKELPRRRSTAEARPTRGGPGVWTIARILGMLSLPVVFAFGAVGLLVSPRIFVASANAVGHRAWWSLLLGFLVLVLGPMAVFLVMVTVVGLPIGVLALIAWTTAVAFSEVPVAIFLGRCIVSPFTTGAVSPYLGLLIGMLVLAGLAWVPVVGVVTGALTVLLGIGAYVRSGKGVLVEMRRYPA